MEKDRENKEDSLDELVNKTNAQKCIKEENERVSMQGRKIGQRQIAQVDYESAESFPASDPPGNY